MIGAMPAVAVRHERRRQDNKRLKRPSQLYLSGQWLPPLQGSPPTPSPHSHNNLDPRPELYLCGKVTLVIVNRGVNVQGGTPDTVEKIRGVSSLHRQNASMSVP